MRSHHLKSLACGMIVSLGVAACAAAADWPQFLGPQSDGVAHESPPLARAWPAGGPKILWQQPVGEGYGGAAICGDSVFLLDRDGNAGDVLRRFDLADGHEVWRYAYPAPGKSDHNGSRSTPATDGKLVFSVGPSGRISAVKFSDGSLVWKKDNLLTDWDAQKPDWDVTTSPILYGDCVIVMTWGKKAALVAYDKATGSVVWTTPNPKDVVQQYESPVPMKFDGRDMILASGWQCSLIGVDARTGERLWDCDVYPKGVRWWQIPSPLPIGDGRIFITNGYDQGSVMLKIARLTYEEKLKPENQGRQYEVAKLWANKNMGSKCSQALLWNGYLYGNSSDVGGGLRCITLDGAVKWDSGVQFDLGALIIADGLIYITHGSNGELVMAAASPEGYKELGRAPILAPPEPWAPPAFANGKLVIRDMHKIICLDVTAAKIWDSTGRPQ